MNSALPKLHFEALDRWLTQQQPSGKTVISTLMLFRVMCNYATVVTWGRVFLWSDLCRVFVGLWELQPWQQCICYGREGEKRGEKKRDKLAFKRRERGPSASWAELNWRFCTDWWHLHMCCLYKYHQNREQVNFKWAQKTDRDAKGQFTDVRKGFTSLLTLGLFQFCTAEM